MSRPVEQYSALLDEILGSYDLSHDFGRRSAYEAVIDYARENLAGQPHCNDVLGAAAQRLGFAPVTFDSIESRVKLPRGAWLDLWISDEDDEVALTGTREGLQYLIDLLQQLKNSTDRDEHIHLDRAYLPLTENSANLVLFKEDEPWFTGTNVDPDLERYPQRDIEPSAIYAIQFAHYPPDDLPITASRLYRVISALPVDQESPNTKEFFEGSPDRYCEFTFVADNGKRFTYRFHLDDPGVNYFTHREIMALVLQPL